MVYAIQPILKLLVVGRTEIGPVEGEESIHLRQLRRNRSRQVVVTQIHVDKVIQAAQRGRNGPRQIVPVEEEGSETLVPRVGGTLRGTDRMSAPAK